MNVSMANMLTVNLPTSEHRLPITHGGQLVIEQRKESIQLFAEESELLKRDGQVHTSVGKLA